MLILLSLCTGVYKHEYTKCRMEMQEEKVARCPQILCMDLHIAMATFSLAKAKGKDKAK